MNDVMKFSLPFYRVKRFASVVMLYLDFGSIFSSLVSLVLGQQGNHVLGFYKTLLFSVLSRFNSFLMFLLRVLKFLNFF